MTAVAAPVQVPPPVVSGRSAVRLDRVVWGVLLATAGTGWLLDELGLDVPWRLFPAAAVVLVGIALLTTLVGGGGRAGLLALGAVLLAGAMAVGVGVDRFTGPVGDRTLAVGAGNWPPSTRISAGTVTVDLTRHPLPAAGRLEVAVGTGRAVLVVPAGARVDVDASVVAGSITVDNHEGLDLRWSDPAGAGAPLRIALDVGLGDIEVTHG